MKTRLLLLSLLTLCLTVSNSFAQNRWGIIGGVNLSTSTAHDVGSWSKFDSKWRTGGYVGGLYDIRLHESWYIQPQLVFSYEVDRTEYVDGKKTSGNVDVSTRMYSLTLPILASFKVDLHNDLALRISAGPYLQYAMFGKDRTLFGEGSKQQVYTSSWSMGFWKHFICGVKGGISLERNHWLFSVDSKYSLMRHSLNHHGHGLTLSAGIGYKF